MGLLNRPYYLRDLISSSAKFAELEGLYTNISLIERKPKPDKQHGVKRGTFISEVVHAGAVTVNPDTGYDILGENQSAIYFSKTEAGKSDSGSLRIYPNLTFIGDIQPELVVLRNVCGNGPEADKIFQWLYAVVDDAVFERRNVRVRIFSLPNYLICS